MQKLTELQIAWLKASQITAINAHEWRDITQRNALPLESLLILSNDEWKQIGLTDKAISQRQESKPFIDNAVAFVETNDIQCITYDCITYPTALTQLSQPPCVLFAKGNLNAISRPCFAIVGSRLASINGKITASDIAKTLANAGIAVVSGLARGIDAAAHKGAIQEGITIAVLGCGIDVCYPKYHQSLQDQIIANNGLIITEFLPGTPPRAHHFPCRNRIVAALCLGILVIEAKIRSGSLITANLAADLGRDVFAVPGNINQPLSEGVNWLIQQGAMLVASAEDILSEYQLTEKAETADKKTKQKRLASNAILDSVDYDVTVVDDIAKRSKQPTESVLAALLEYELRGFVAAVPGGYIKLRGN